jgi:hypothetical protein
MREWRAVAVAALMVALSGGALAVARTVGLTAAHQRAARLEAQRALGELSLPAGASASANDPAPAVLSAPVLRPGSARLVDLHRFWVVPGTPAAVIGWVKDNAQPGWTVSESGSDRGPQGRVSDSLALTHVRPAAGVWSSTLLVTATPLPSGAAAVRADAQAIPLLVRPRWARIPWDVRAVTVTGARLARPVTITTPARVRRIVQLLDRLPVWQLGGGPEACPIDRGPLLMLSFFRRLGDARPVGVADADGSGCRTVSLTVRGRTAPVLSGGPRLISALGIR